MLVASAAGLWLVSLMLMLGCGALVFGNEKEDLRHRFGNELRSPLISLPAAASESVTGWHRLSVYILVILLWLVMYEAFVFVGVTSDSFTLYLPVENTLPVVEWMEVIYASTYLLVVMVPLVARRQNQLRGFAISGLLATGVIGLMFFVIPVIAPPRLFDPATALGRLLHWEQAYDTPGAAFPSFHVVWAFIAATLYTGVFPRLKLVWYGWATAVAVSCVTTGMHAILDVVAGIGLFLLLRHRQTLWLRLLRSMEGIANSWREWRLGPVRVINHGFYAGAAALVGLSIVGLLIPEATPGVLLIITICSLIMGDLMAQAIEGSSRLLRPFGYYGAVLGVIIGSVLVCFLMGVSVWRVLGAFAVAAPCIQAISRLRCLVQGCCHGRETISEATGIRYNQPTSRVTLMAGLSGRPLYPAPLYSILCNAVTLLRLWVLSTPLTMIIGLYLLLSGFGRFVEESYRGEPQTPLFGGLHIYQCLAIASVVVGACLTGINIPPVPGALFWRWDILVSALSGGVLATFAMGIDFPGSNRRFARLTS